MQVFVAYHTDNSITTYTLGVFSSPDLARAQIETFAMGEAKADCDAAFDIPGWRAAQNLGADPGRIKKAFDEYCIQCWIKPYDLDGEK